MAARRVTKLNIDWNALAERVPAENKHLFFALKSRTEANLRKMVSLPEKAPAIDWAFYKSRINKAALVDTFQKKYETLQIPFPVDTVTAKINEHEKEVEKLKLDDIAQSNALIKQCEEKLAILKDRLPIAEMTMEEAAEAFPGLIVDANNPTPWPHTEEEIAIWKQHEEEEKSGKVPADH